MEYVLKKKKKRNNCSAKVHGETLRGKKNLAMWNLCIQVRAWAELQGYLESRQQFKDLIAARRLKVCHRSATNKGKLNGHLYFVHFFFKV